MPSTHIRIGDRTYKVMVHPDGTASVDGVAITADIRHLAPGVLSLLVTQSDGTQQSIRCLADPSPDAPAVILNGLRVAYTVSDPRSLRAASAASAASGPRPLKSPMPGRIVRVLVAAGDQVEAGQGCVVIEAMKMQNELKAPRSGTIARLTATPGETVSAGTTLLVVE